MTFENFHLLLSHGILLGSQTHFGHEGVLPCCPAWGGLAALLLICRNAAKAGPLQALHPHSAELWDCCRNRAQLRPPPTFGTPKISSRT